MSGINLTAVQIDTSSIQKYVFLSNKLKENVGASYIVKKIYEDELKEALEKIFNQSVNLFAWKKNPNKIYIENDGDIHFEIGYFGGGNALILFREREKTSNFIREFTKLLLKRYPSLYVFFGVINDFNLSAFNSSMKKLHQSLKQNRNKFFPNTTLAKYGFTADCPRTNESAEAFRDQDNNIVSSIVKVKLDAAERATNDLKNVLKDILQDKYTITNDVEKFGQKVKDINYISIVHIDGNKIGVRFQQCRTLAEIRELSISVELATETAFKETVKEVINRIENETISKKNGFNLEEENGRIILPLRPIIMSGDDITVVCEGRLGFWLAETFTKRIITKQVSDGKYLSACCSTAIFKTKYPFYRAYRMAKYLVDKAKKTSRDNDDSSYIDFFVSYGGWTGEAIRESYYQAIAGNLHFGPYKIDGDRQREINHIDNLKEVIKGLKKLPKNKVMELRDILHKDEKHSEMFMRELSARGHILPTIAGINEIWMEGNYGKITPYFDAIELMEFYPDGLK